VSAGRPPLAVRDQTSAGGVAYRRAEAGFEVALVLVDARRGARWQLPKGTVDEGETPEQAATREVREEAGIAAELEAPLETIEYWFVATDFGRRTRIHKRVHFFLFRYLAGDVADHDHEVLEARWVPLAEAEAMLAFPGERRMVALARAWLEPPAA